MNTIAGYPVVGQVNTSAGVLPLVDIPMMGDDQWQQLARENAVHNYTRIHGQEPESEEAAVEWQNKWLIAREKLEDSHD